MEVKAGDRIELKSQKVGAKVRRGAVLEVLSPDPLELRIRWDDGAESNFYPVGGTFDVISAQND